MKYFLFLSILFYISCTTTQPEVVIPNALVKDTVLHRNGDSVRLRIMLDRKDIKIEYAALSSSNMTRKEVTSLVSDALRPLNDKITTLTTANTALALRVKKTEDSLKIAIKDLGPDFNNNTRNQLQISPSGVNRIKGEIKP